MYRWAQDLGIIDCTQLVSPASYELIVSALFFGQHYGVNKSALWCLFNILHSCVLPFVDLIATVVIVTKSDPLVLNPPGELHINIEVGIALQCWENNAHMVLLAS